ncbi:MAG: hypothetical protein WC044_09280 [Crocinitomicaceae bacterium]
MTKKDLFKIILKLYGLYSIIGLVVQLPFAGYSLLYDSRGDLDWMFLLVPIVSLLVVYTLLFKSEWVIQLLRLDQGFDTEEATDPSIGGQAVVVIALVILAVYMIVNNIGDFVSQIVFSFRDNVSSDNFARLNPTLNLFPVNYNMLLSAGLNLLIGFLLLTNYTRVSKWIVRINQTNAG